MTKKGKKKTSNAMTFDGIFTSGIRDRLRQRRRELGLSYASLGAFFNINWSTIRKWEKGPTVRCGISQRPQIEHFLNGDYDKILTKMQNEYYSNSRSRFLPAMVQAYIERIPNTYILCSGNPELKSKLINEITARTSQIIDQLIRPISSETINSRPHNFHKQRK